MEQNATLSWITILSNFAAGIWWDQLWVCGHHLEGQLGPVGVGRITFLVHEMP